MARLFFALQPSPADRASLHRAAIRCSGQFGGRAVEEADLHLTLCFLGEVAGDRIPALLEAAAGVRADALELSLGAVERWPKARILCAVPGAGSDLGSESLLANALRAAVTEAGFSPDARPFRPHVTLLRGLPARADATTPLSMELSPPQLLRTRRFVLMRSQRLPDGRAYRLVGAWPGDEAGTQLPWMPYFSRTGSLMVATGPSLMRCASRITRSLRCSARRFTTPIT